MRELEVCSRDPGVRDNAKLVVHEAPFSACGLLEDLSMPERFESVESVRTIQIDAGKEQVAVKLATEHGRGGHERPAFLIHARESSVDELCKAAREREGRDEIVECSDAAGDPRAVGVTGQ
jgi:hypothetical protein